MTISSMVDARAWAFEQVVHRPAPMPASYPGGIPYASMVIPPPPSLRAQIADAEALAQWVYSGAMPEKS